MLSQWMKLTDSNHINLKLVVVSIVFWSLKV